MPKRQLSTGTDWERVKREAAHDAPIPHDANDDPYDPAATAAYWHGRELARNYQHPTPPNTPSLHDLGAYLGALFAFKNSQPSIHAG